MKPNSKNTIYEIHALRCLGGQSKRNRADLRNLPHEVIDRGRRMTPARLYNVADVLALRTAHFARWKAETEQIKQSPHELPNSQTPHPLEPIGTATAKRDRLGRYLELTTPCCKRLVIHAPPFAANMGRFSRRTCDQCGAQYWLEAAHLAPSPPIHSRD